MCSGEAIIIIFCTYEHGVHVSHSSAFVLTCISLIFSYVTSGNKMECMDDIMTVV